MEIYFDKSMKGGKISGAGISAGKLSAGKLSAGKLSAGSLPKKSKQNAELKKAIRELLKSHKIKNINKHIKHMEGSGLFDTIVGGIKTGIEKGIKIYKDNKDTIDKIVGEAVKHAPTAIEMIKKMKGGALTPLQAWNKKLDEYQSEHGCSRKEAMIALKRKSK